MVGPDYIEVIAQESITPVMAARAVMPFYDGYGKKKQQTSYVVEYLGRQRRIYCDAIGNGGVCYVLVKGVKHYVH